VGEKPTENLFFFSPVPPTDGHYVSLPNSLGGLFACRFFSPPPSPFLLAHPSTQILSERNFVSFSHRHIATFFPPPRVHTRATLLTCTGGPLFSTFLSSVLFLLNSFPRSFLTELLGFSFSCHVSNKNPLQPITTAVLAPHGPMDPRLMHQNGHVKEAPDT